MAVIIFALGIKSTNGLVKSTINTANALVKQNIDTTIINIVGTNGGLDFLVPAFSLDERVQKYSLDNLDLNKIEKQDLKSKVFLLEKQQYLTATYTYYHAEVLKEINKQLTSNDLVIFTHPLAMKLYIESNPNSKVKKLIKIHGNYLEEVNNYKLLEKYFDKVDYIQAVSKYMKNDLIDFLNAPKDKTIFIPNIVAPLVLNKKRDTDTKRVSIIASIQERKNQLDAIKVIECLRSQDIVLQIYGNPLGNEYFSSLKEYIGTNELEDKVVFKGVGVESEIYENSDIVILTSQHEGFPYIFLESAVYKIPVIAYDFKYGAKEFSQDRENGCLVPMGDYQKMAEVIESLLNDEEKYSRIVHINEKHFNNSYREEKIVAQYLSLLGEHQTKFLLEGLFLKKVVAWIKEEGNNNIVKVGNDIDSRGSSVKIKGNNNNVVIDDGVLIRHCNISLKGNNIRLHIHKNVELTGVIASLFQNTILVIDENSTLGNGEITIAEENKITIGKDCMFAHGHELRTSDMHPLYSLESGERINGGKDITIGNHVWFGKNVTILKGSSIGNNSVVAINSIVTKVISDTNVVIGGSPAKVLKKDVIWGRKMYHETMHDDPTLGAFINEYKEKRVEVKERGFFQKLSIKVKGLKCLS